MIPSSELNWARQEQQEVAGHSPLLSSSWHTSEQPQQEDWPSEQGLAAAPLFHSFPYTPVSAAKPSAPATVIQQQDWPEPPNNWENTMILAAHHPPPHHHHHPTNAGTQSTSHDHVQDPSLNMAITQAEPLMSSISRQYEALLSSGVNPSSSLSAAGAIAQAPQFGWSLMGAGRNGGHQQSLWMQEEDNTGSYNLTPYSSTTYNGGAPGVACDNNLSLYIDHHSNGGAATTSSNNTSADHAARLDLLGLGSLDQRRLQEIMVKREVPGTCDLINSRIGLNLGGRTYFSSADNHEDSFYGWMGKFGKRFRHGVGGLAAHPMTPVPNCQADGCNADLSMAKHYHRRHKVCAYHSKSPTVSIAGQTQRFCQQCSRFHSLPEFDDVKRSCRKRLADHNRRRRKPPQPPHPAGSASAPTAAGPAATSADGPARRTASDEDSHDRHNNAGNQTSKEEEWPLSAIPLTSESLAISQEGNNVNKIRQNDEDDNDEGSDSDEHNQLKSCGPSLSLTTTTVPTSFNDVATHRQQTHVHDAYGGTMQWLRRGTSRENALMEVVASRSLHGLTDGGNMDKSLTLNTAFSEVSENHSSMNFSNLQGLKLPHNKSLFLGNNI